MPLLDPVSADWNTVAKFGDYESAQRAVDRLSDDGFPVEKLDIVGSGVRACGQACFSGCCSGCSRRGTPSS